MTRTEKIERMARAWCQWNGWNPDHRPMEFNWRSVRMEGNDLKAEPIRYQGEPIWKNHVPAMEKLLEAIE